MATHSSILAWEIPWTEEPGKESQKVHGVTKSRTQLKGLSSCTSIQNSMQKSKHTHQWNFIKQTHLIKRNLTRDPCDPPSLYLSSRAFSPQTWHRYISHGLHNKWHWTVFSVLYYICEICPYCWVWLSPCLAGEYCTLRLRHTLYIYSTEDDIWVVSILRPLPAGFQEYSYPCQMSF